LSELFVAIVLYSADCFRWWRVIMDEVQLCGDQTNAA